MVADHPLIEYIEDGFADKDIQGYKKFVEKFTADFPQVQIGIKALFESNLETIKTYTAMV